jgi:DNA-binding NarL/FixJ family response regulator
MINIIIAEDNKIVRKGTVDLLNRQKDMCVIGEASGGLEVIHLLQSGMRPDIVLADMNMPEMDGISLTGEIVSRFPGVKVAILTMHEKEDFINRSIAAGASGYVLKDGNFDTLFTAIRTIAGGGTFIASLDL